MIRRIQRLRRSLVVFQGYVGEADDSTSSQHIRRFLQGRTTSAVYFWVVSFLCVPSLWPLSKPLHLPPAQTLNCSFYFSAPMASQDISALVNNGAASSNTLASPRLDVPANEVSNTSPLATSLATSKRLRRSSIQNRHSQRTPSLSPPYVWTLNAAVVLLVLALTKYYAARYVKCLRRVSSPDAGKLPTAPKGTVSVSNVSRRLTIGRGAASSSAGSAGRARFRAKSAAEMCQEEVGRELNSRRPGSTFYADIPLLEERPSPEQPARVRSETRLEVVLTVMMLTCGVSGLLGLTLLAAWYFLCPAYSPQLEGLVIVLSASVILVALVLSFLIYAMCRISKKKTAFCRVVLGDKAREFL